MTTLTFFSVKGGDGCTTVATLYALQLAMGNNPAHLSTDGNEAQVGDVHALLGLTGDHALPGPFTISPFSSEEDDVINVVDRGLVEPTFGRHSPHLDAPSILVIRNTYLSLRRWTQANLGRPDAVVLVEEPKRPLHVSDVAEVIGTQVTEVFQVTDKLARLSDAGILSYGRHPHMLHHLDRLAGVRR